MPAYSIPSHWGIISTLDDSQIGGLRQLMTSIEPLISIDSTNNATKRKFRNAWELMWDKFSEINGVSPSEREAMYTVGLKLPYFLAMLGTESEGDLKDIRILLTEREILNKFYNAVIGWFTATQYINLLHVMDKDIVDAVILMATTDNHEFTEILNTKTNIWDN